MTKKSKEKDFGVVGEFYWTKKWRPVFVVGKGGVNISEHETAEDAEAACKALGKI